MKKTLLAALLAMAGTANAAVIYSNGPVVDVSGKSVVAPGAGFYGWSAQTTAGNRVADNFSVGLGETWNISSIGFFSYQTGATGFTFQNATWSIVQGDVNTGAVLASGVTALTDGGRVGYRVTSGTLTDTQRPIYRAEADVTDFSLGTGEYWLRWSLTGSLASGPFIPTTADFKVGNAVQGINNGSFNPLTDANHGVELPFELYGSILTSNSSNVPEPTGIALLGLGLVGLVVTRKRK